MATPEQPSVRGSKAPPAKRRFRALPPASGSVPGQAGAASRAKGTRGRPSRRRVLIWLAEVIVLAAAVEHFIIRPSLRGRRSEPAPPALVLTGERAPALGEAARELPGLREVAPAFLAPLEGLADGSMAAQQAQLLTARDARLPVEVENSVGMRFRLVPAGTSIMGSPPTEAQRWEGEIEHVVAIPSPFYMGMHEVTQAQWRAVMATAPAHFAGDRRPVEDVTWYDCQRFLLALTDLEALPLGSYRLPLEREWEYACRAGTTTAYCFGDDPARLEFYADFAGNNYTGTREVGRRLPNAYGLHDMHGNVWEWCQDRYRGYLGLADARDIADGQWRVVRGGNWYIPAAECRSANRARLPPLSHGNVLGLRVVRLIDLPSPGTPPATGETPPAATATKAADEGANVPDAAPATP